MSTLKIELHCHTYHSKDCLMLPGQLLQQCTLKEIDRVAITDHNAIEGAFEAAALDPDRVIIGEEIMTTEGELLGYYMKENVPSGLSPIETISRLRKQGALISIAHPFDPVRQGAWKREALFEILKLVDAIEVFNARTWSSSANDLAAKVASSEGMLATVGSDAHAPFEIGQAVMIVPEFHDAEGMLQALSNAQVIARRSSRLVHLLSRYATFRKALGWNPRSG
jgi:predicted metal-dependent phosphoesterase TrpH